MSLDIGIVGLPNVGKSTVFNALTGAGILAANYPFATIEPNTGVVPIPDPRVGVLGEVLGSSRVIHATVKFVDIAGLVKGASEGEGLGNRFLATIREVAAICHVVRAFESPNVVHVDDEMSPADDIATIETELALADLQTVERRLPKLEKEATIDRSLAREAEVLRNVRDTLGSGGMIYRSPDLMADFRHFADLHLLTAKPVIYLFNCSERVLESEEEIDELRHLVAPAEAVFLDAQIESEIVSLNLEDRVEMLASIGQTEPGLDRLAKAAYRALGLQSFLTGGEKESRAWTIKAGATAFEAAGVIHTDFQRGFIAAEVIDFDKLVEAGSWAAARSRGLVRTEGKSYVMRPDDVVEFRFNV